MAKENFAACLAHVLASEGGYVDHPEDPGGATNRGITLATYRRYCTGATKADLRAISDEMVATIYRNGYWDRLRADDLPAGLDLVAFDAAVNSGVVRGARWLQSALGATPDGMIGPGTLAIARRASAPEAIRRALQARRSFLASLNTWSIFGRGWAARLARLEATALTMAKGA